jgi:hypothetical protein
MFRDKAKENVWNGKRRRGRRELHNDELRNQHLSPNDEVKETEMGRACSTHEREEECKEGFGGKPERTIH